MRIETNTTRSVRWQRHALRWMPTFLGFPAGGFAAKALVGPVDRLSAALIGGALTGAILGIAQWLGMRRVGPGPEAWMLATGVGFAVGLGVGAAAVGYETSTGALAVQGAICGAAVGVAQAFVVRARLGRIVVLWPVLLAGLWALGWTITSRAGVDVEAQYTVFGSTGAIVVTAATAILPILLAGSLVPRLRRSSALLRPLPRDDGPRLSR